MSQVSQIADEEEKMKLLVVMVIASNPAFDHAATDQNGRMYRQGESIKGIII